MLHAKRKTKAGGRPRKDPIQVRTFLVAFVVEGSLYEERCYFG